MSYRAYWLASTEEKGRRDQLPMLQSSLIVQTRKWAHGIERSKGSKEGQKEMIRVGFEPTPRRTSVLDLSTETIDLKLAD